MRNPNVATDPLTADVMARLLGSRKRIIDLGCGTGVLLKAASIESPGATDLIGIDIDPERLPDRAPSRFEYRVGDALQLPNRPAFDGIISNPPYITVRQLDPGERNALRREFMSLSGQFDLAFAFVEKAIRLLEVGGRGVFLLPQGLKTRPAAMRLRLLLDENCRWGTVEVTTRPYSLDVGVEAEILWFDRIRKARVSLNHDSPMKGEWSSRVSVGIATGANNTFIRADSDPWLEEIGPCFVRRFVRGRDIVGTRLEEDAAEAGRRLIVPYVVRGESMIPANEQEHAGLSRFLRAHRYNLGNGGARGPGRFIQCPAPGILGSRVVVPEVFQEPTALPVPHGVAVLNSAFIVSPPPGSSAEAVATALRSEAARRLVFRHTRKLGSGYHRITANGLTLALDQLLRGGYIH